MVPHVPLEEEPVSNGSGEDPDPQQHAFSLGSEL